MVAKTILVTQIIIYLFLTAGCLVNQSQNYNESALVNSNTTPSRERVANSEKNTNAAAAQHEQQGSINDNQLRFGMEYEIRKKSPIPADIWEAIIDSEENGLTRDQVLEQNYPNKWVDASQIDLNNDALEDYILVAKSGNWLGANVTTFWVFLNVNGQYRLVLKTSALQLEFSNLLNKRFRAITTVTLTAREFSETKYIYNGSTFRVQSSRTGKLN